MTEVLELDLDSDMVVLSACLTGRCKAEALRLARREIKTKYPNPFYCAVFILHGER